MRRDTLRALETEISRTKDEDQEWILLGSLVFAETLQAIAQAPLERRGRIGIKSHEIPERLAAVTAQPGERVRVRVGVPGDIFANRAVRVSRHLVQRLRIGAGGFANPPPQV